MRVRLCFMVISRKCDSLRFVTTMSLHTHCGRFGDLFTDLMPLEEAKQLRDLAKLDGLYASIVDRAGAPVRLTQEVKP